MNSVLIVVLALASLACGNVVTVDKQVALENTAYGYLTKIGVPEAERIRIAEERARIVGGSAAALGQYPYQAGLLIDIVGLTGGRGVCGGSVLSNNRIITAAHCWTDGINQSWRFEVILGTTSLYYGGIRQLTSEVVVHPQWTPQLIRNDIAVIYLPTPVPFSPAIAPVSLPSGSELSEDFAGESAIASGFGLTASGVGIQPDQFLSHVRLNIITNRVCSLAFPYIVQSSNICTSGVGGIGTCNGDSGGPLVVVRGDRYVLAGIVSFGNGLVGCDGGFPAAYARVTSYISFLQQHM